MKHSLFGAAGILAMLFCSPAMAQTVTLQPITSSEPRTIVNTRTCARPNAEAAVDFALFDTPTIAMLQGVSGTTTLRIALDENGALRSASLVQSSGNVWIDRSAMSTAYTSVFNPKIQNCDRVSSAYLYQLSY